MTYAFRQDAQEAKIGNDSPLPSETVFPEPINLPSGIQPADQPVISMRNSEKYMELFAPGRLCLFGEHTDWASQFGVHRGACLVIGTDQGLFAQVRSSDQFIVEAWVDECPGRADKSTDSAGRIRRVAFPWQKKALLDVARDQNDFFRYCTGVACQMISQPGVNGGLEIRVFHMDLPLQKGVSSSAAVCVLVARAFDEVYSLGLFPHEIMELAYLGERLTGSQCGRMDQACIYGKTPVLLTFEGRDQCRVEPIFPRKDIHMFFVDLAGRKDTVRILQDLHAAYPNSRRLRKALGLDNERIIRRAYRALERGDAPQLGALMNEAQALFDGCVGPHSPEQLESPLLHTLLATEALKPHIYGGKGVGSQGDGTAQFVARSLADCHAAMALVEQAYPSTRAFPLTIPASRRPVALKIPSIDKQLAREDLWPSDWATRHQGHTVSGTLP